MPAQSRPSCPHDLGPGITVCLRCRQAERQTIRGRQQRILGLGAAVVVAVALLGSAAVGAVRGGHRAPGVAGETVTQQGDTMPSTVAAMAAPATTPAAKTSVATASASGLPALVVAEGHTPLADGLDVERNGDQAVVSFDTPLTRTRRRDKVEQVIRATLPALFGSPASAALARIPNGELSQGDLLTQVVPAGIRVPLAAGAIAITLETRSGQDGPLVVRYRARVVPR